jgi:hypothetical protein
MSTQALNSELVPAPLQSAFAPAIDGAARNKAWEFLLAALQAQALFDECKQEAHVWNVFSKALHVPGGAKYWCGDIATKELQRLGARNIYASRKGYKTYDFSWEHEHGGINDLLAYQSREMLLNIKYVPAKAASGQDHFSRFLSDAFFAAVDKYIHADLKNLNIAAIAVLSKAASLSELWSPLLHSEVRVCRINLDPRQTFAKHIEMRETDGVLDVWLTKGAYRKVLTGSAQAPLIGLAGRKGHAVIDFAVHSSRTPNSYIILTPRKIDLHELDNMEEFLVWLP